MDIQKGQSWLFTNQTFKNITHFQFSITLVEISHILMPKLQLPRGKQPRHVDDGAGPTHADSREGARSRRAALYSRRTDKDGVEFLDTISVSKGGRFFFCVLRKRGAWSWGVSCSQQLGNVLIKTFSSPTIFVLCLCAAAVCQPQFWLVTGTLCVSLIL